jgi:hypothetical protein
MIPLPADASGFRAELVQQCKEQMLSQSLQRICVACRAYQYGYPSNFNAVEQLATTAGT